MKLSTDNPYLGIEIEGKDRLGLRDCDRVWVMHLLSFYKELLPNQKDTNSRKNTCATG